MDTKALFNIGYGLYVLTAENEGKDNGCIINTVMQVTSDPCQIAIAVNKRNFTTEMIQKEVLTEYCTLRRTQTLICQLMFSRKLI